MDRDGDDSKLQMEDEDVSERDPEKINQHLKTTFHEVIAEPDDTIFSFDLIWTCSAKTFTTTKLWCYRITSAILAIPIMFVWGIFFALMSFCTIWLCVPCFKFFDIEASCFRRIWGTCVQTCLEPCYLAAGKIFYNIRITRQ